MFLKYILQRFAQFDRYDFFKEVGGVQEPKAARPRIIERTEICQVYTYRSAGQTRRRRRHALTSTAIGPFLRKDLFPIGGSGEKGRAVSKESGDRTSAKTAQVKLN